MAKRQQSENTKTMQQRFNVTDKRVETEADKEFAETSRRVFAAVASGEMTPEEGQAAMAEASKRKWSSAK
jgi:hypothetical protein